MPFSYKTDFDFLFFHYTFIFLAPRSLPPTLPSFLRSYGVLKWENIALVAKHITSTFATPHFGPPPSLQASSPPSHVRGRNLYPSGVQSQQGLLPFPLLSSLCSPVSLLCCLSLRGLFSGAHILYIFRPLSPILFCRTLHFSIVPVQIFHSESCFYYPPSLSAYYMTIPTLCIILVIKIIINCTTV